jgi:hypothetical protein
LFPLLTGPTIRVGTPGAGAEGSGGTSSRPARGAAAPRRRTPRRAAPRSQSVPLRRRDRQGERCWTVHDCFFTVRGRRPRARTVWGRRPRELRATDKYAALPPARPARSVPSRGELGADESPETPRWPSRTIKHSGWFVSTQLLRCKLQLQPAAALQLRSCPRICRYRLHDKLHHHPRNAEKDTSAVN